MSELTRDPEAVATELAGKLSARTRHVCVLLGAGALVYLWRRETRSKDDLDYALVLMSIAWAALLLGFLFPGTAQTAAEHPEVVPHFGPLWLNEVFIATTSEAATLVAFFFERRRRSRP